VGAAFARHAEGLVLIGLDFSSANRAWRYLLLAVAPRSSKRHATLTRQVVGFHET
jgi:hypothetical protein